MLDSLLSFSEIFGLEVLDFKLDGLFDLLARFFSISPQLRPYDVQFHLFFDFLSLESLQVVGLDVAERLGSRLLGWFLLVDDLHGMIWVCTGSVDLTAIFDGCKVWSCATDHIELLILAEDRILLGVLRLRRIAARVLHEQVLLHLGRIVCDGGLRALLVFLARVEGHFLSAAFAFPTKNALPFSFLSFVRLGLL